MDPMQQLISGLLDDELSSEQAQKLAGALESDPDAIDRLVMGSFIHSQLLAWMSQSRLMDPAALVASDLSIGFSDSVADPMSKSSRWWSRRSFAAVLAVAASVAVVAYLMALRPAVVAQLTSATDTRWSVSQADIPVGSLLKDRQELSLEKGSALITFVSGTQLLLEAPASVRLAGPNQIYMRGGRIAAKVPTQARGFSVASSLARFDDLGTQFTLRLDAEKSFQLHVFEGLVELQLDPRFGEEAQQPLRVAEVRTVVFDAETGEITAPPFEEGKQMPF
jgi:ferric-dicitrate binding protein FerR (iron transport regulator)